MDAEVMVDDPKKNSKSTGKGSALTSPDVHATSQISVSVSNQDVLTKIEEVEEDGSQKDQDFDDEGMLGDKSGEAEEEDSDLDRIFDSNDFGGVGIAFSVNHVANIASDSRTVLFETVGKYKVGPFLACDNVNKTMRVSKYITCTRSGLESLGIIYYQYLRSWAIREPDLSLERIVQLSSNIFQKETMENYPDGTCNGFLFIDNRQDNHRVEHKILRQYFGKNLEGVLLKEYNYFGEGVIVTIGSGGASAEKFLKTKEIFFNSQSKQNLAMQREAIFEALLECYCQTPTCGGSGCFISSKGGSAWTNERIRMLTIKEQFGPQKILQRIHTKEEGDAFIMQYRDVIHTDTIPKVLSKLCVLVERSKRLLPRLLFLHANLVIKSGRLKPKGLLHVRSRSPLADLVTLAPEELWEVAAAILGRRRYSLVNFGAGRTNEINFSLCDFCLIQF